MIKYQGLAEERSRDYLREAQDVQIPGRLTIEGGHGEGLRAKRVAEEKVSRLIGRSD